MIARRTGLALAIAALGIGPVAAQQPGAPDPAAAPTRRMADGHPDLNVWWGGNFVFGSFDKLNLDPKAAFWEDPPCDDKDLAHIVTKERG